MAGDSPAALGAPGMHPVVCALPVPKLGGKLPPRTAKLAVPPGSNRVVPAQNCTSNSRKKKNGLLGLL